jgi:hypothetical protein
MLRKRLNIFAKLTGVALIVVAVSLGIRALRNHIPDSLNEIRSPDGSFRLVVAEELAGFPGQVCIKDAYVLSADAKLDWSGEDNHIYAGACDGLLDIHWNGSQVEGTVNLKAATEGVSYVMVRRYGAEGKVQINWLTGHQ